MDYARATIVGFVYSGFKVLDFLNRESVALSSVHQDMVFQMNAENRYSHFS